MSGYNDYDDYQSGYKTEKNMSDSKTNYEEYEKEYRPLGMKWFKFNIYFLIWLGMLMNLADGLGYITGSVYFNEGLDPREVYSVFPKLKNVDRFFGVVACLFALLQLITRYRLARYKRYAPYFLYACYVIGAVFSFSYAVAVGIILDGQIITAQVIGSIAGSVLMLGINFNYFRKREYLFVN